MQEPEKFSAGARISRADALELESAPLFKLARLAASRRAGGGTAGYIVNRMINYSNVCAARCKFCAYHAKAGVVPPFRLSDGEIFDLCADAVERGGVQIMLQGGLHPDFTLEWAQRLLSRVKSAFPKLWLHVFSPSEIVWFARGAGVSIAEAVRRLKAAGADSVPGAADLLVGRVRGELCPGKCSVGEWREVMRALAENSMSSSATMTFGMGETFAERIEHLDVVRGTQDETGVFKAFIAWPVSPERTGIERRVERAGAVEFLRTLAVARIYLDNIEHMQSGWLTEGLKVAEVALLFGADDVGGVLMDEMVVRAAGIDNRATAENMRAAIRSAGFRPRERGGLYETLREF